MKRLVFSLAFPLFAVALMGAWCREPSASADGKMSAAHLRQPVAVVPADDGRRLFVANRRTGTVSVINGDSGRVIDETAVGRLLADLADAGDGRLLAVDETAGELLVLERKRDRLTVTGRVCVGDSPVSVRTFASAKAAVSCLWPRQLALLDVEADKRPRLAKMIDLPFAPRGLLVLPDGVRIVVADAFGGRLAVVNVERGVVESVRSVPGHNIRGLALSSDEKELLLTQQVLAEEMPTRADDIRWGNVITNAVRSLSLDDLLKPDADLLRRSHLQPLGEFRRGAADPAELIVVDGKTIVALAGTGEIAVGANRRGDWQRLRVGRRPTALSSSGHHIFVVDTFGDKITILDREKVEKVAEISLGSTSEPTPAERGEMLFFDARLSVEGWMSCHSCHSDAHTNGLRADTFGDGSYETPKRIPTLRGVGDTAPWTWNGSMDRLEDQVRHSIEITMHGARPTAAQVADLTAYLRTLLPPPPRGASTAGAARRGETIFRERGCARCHPPPTYTTMKTYEVGLEDEMGNKAFNPPSLRGVGHGGTFFHDGRAAALEEVFTRYRHQVPADMPRHEVDDLLAFLRTL